MNFLLVININYGTKGPKVTKDPIGVQTVQRSMNSAWFRKFAFHPLSQLIRAENEIQIYLFDEPYNRIRFELYILKKLNQYKKFHTPTIYKKFKFKSQPFKGV